MNRLHLDQDIRPLSEFRERVASMIQHVHRTHRPIVITHHGKSTAVLLDVGEYESLLDRIELVQDVRDAEMQISNHEGIPHETAKKTALSRIKK